MTGYLFPPDPQAALPVGGLDARFPVRRIFCVGRNYAAHAAEMGNEVDREAPFYFTKTPCGLAQSGATVPYAPGTDDLHHEVECVVAIGRPAFRVAEGAALDCVWGYGVGLDMTRRDLQAAAKAKARPWDTGKDFEGSAVIGPLTPATRFGTPGPQWLRLDVNGVQRQETQLSDMVWPVAGIIAHLSTLYHLGPGDLIMTGTPAGVGPVHPGDRLTGTLDGAAPVTLTIGAAA
jgi:fumarylpyruvate hydrolase